VIHRTAADADIQVSHGELQQSLAACLPTVIEKHFPPDEEQW
jgi:hypothetical protein